MRIDVRVIPRASRTAVEVKGDRITVRVTAPPVDHEANTAVQEALADALDLPRRAIQIVRGGTSREKTVEIKAADDVIKARLAALGSRG